MSEQIALKPLLFSVEGTKELSQHPSLKGGVCECGHVFFSMQTYGCEVCGRTGDHIKELALSGKGKIKTFTTVYKHLQPKGPSISTYGANPTEVLKVPFVIAVIVLDEGCALRALIDGDGSNLYPGKTVYSTLKLIGRDEENREIMDFRFIDLNNNGE